jgi:hypothetical protein
MSNRHLRRAKVFDQETLSYADILAEPLPSVAQLPVGDKTRQLTLDASLPNTTQT